LERRRRRWQVGAAAAGNIPGLNRLMGESPQAEEKRYAVFLTLEDPVPSAPSCGSWWGGLPNALLPNCHSLN